MNDKIYYLVVFDEELKHDIICFCKATSEYHAKNIAYSHGYSSVKIATDEDKMRINKINQEQLQKCIAEF